MRLNLRTLLLCLSALLPLACAGTASADAFKEGQQYVRATQTQTPADPKRITVEEFFWYGCPHCYDADPTIRAWAEHKPADVDFIRVPNSLGRPVGILHSKMFYTWHALNLPDNTHVTLFDAIHRDHVQLDSEPEIQAFFTDKFGIMPGIFTSTFGSFAVDARTRHAEDLAKLYGIFSVPTIVVGGEYITDAGKAGGFPKMMDVVSFLVDKVRKERAGK